MKKRIVKKSTGIVLSVTMIASLLPAGMSANDGISGHWAEKSVRSFSEKGYLVSPLETKESLKKHMTRAEFIATFNKLIGATKESEKVKAFTDVKQGEWFYKDIAKALEIGYITGTSDKTMSPNSPITRQETFVILAKYLSLTGKNVFPQNIKDASDVSSYAVGYTLGLIEAGYLKGDDKGRLSPKDYITTAEGISLLDRLKEPLKAVATKDDKAPVVYGGGGGGSTSTTSGGSSSGGTTTPVTPVNPSTGSDIFNNEHTKLLDLGIRQYLAIEFNKGFNKANTTIIVDGVDVTSAVTSVTDDGGIVKWEITSLNPHELIVRSNDGKEEKLQLTTNNNSTAPVVKQPKARYILAHGAINVWDYHLDHFDDAGVIRKTIKKTTFNLGNEEKKPIRVYAPDTVIKSSTANKYGVSGEVLVYFNYNTAEEKAWFDALSTQDDVALVSYDERHNALNDDLNYSKDTQVTNTVEGTVGIVKVPVGQVNFYHSGRYNLLFRPEGKRPVLVPIHLVNDLVPTMKISEPGALISGKNIHFAIENMTYGIVSPIESVVLKDPSGKLHELEKIKDWALIGNTFVLYNDENQEKGTKNNVPYKGVYSLTIYSNGFKPFTKQFEIVDGAEVSRSAFRRAGFDTLSSATFSFGGDSSGSTSGGESGGSLKMPANLLFNADLLDNARVLTLLGKDSKVAKAIVDRFDYEMSGIDSIFHRDDKKFYDFTSYSDAVRESKLKGKYLSFEDYIASGSAKENPNRPYAVKEVLEDNALGATEFSGNYHGKIAPELKLKTGNLSVGEGEDAVLTSDDPAFVDYLNAIKHIYINNRTYNRGGYHVDLTNRTLTIDKSMLEPGDNVLDIAADGFRSETVRIKVQKKTESDNLSFEKNDYKVGDKVTLLVDGATGDFFKYVGGIEVTDKDGVKTVIYQGGNEGYDVRGNHLIFGNKVFKKDGAYTIVLTPSKHYAKKTLTLTLAPQDTDTTIKNPPNETPAVTKDASILNTGNYTIQFDADNDTEAWIRAISDITVNGTTYHSGVPSRDTSYSTAVVDGKIILGNGAIKNGNNTVVIKATGYNDKTVTFTANEPNNPSEEPGNEPTPNPGTGGNTEQPGTLKEVPSQPISTSVALQDYKIQFKSESSSHTPEAQWLSKVNKVTVNGSVYTRGLVWHSANYAVYPIDGNISVGNPAFVDGVNTILIEAEGYKPLTLKMKKDGTLVTGSEENTGNEGINPNPGTGGNENPSTGGNETPVPQPSDQTPPPAKSSNKSVFGEYKISVGMGQDAFMNAITGVSVNGETYTNGYVADDSKNYSLQKTDGDIRLGALGFTQEENTIVITATGYKPLTVKVKKDGTLVTSETPAPNPGGEGNGGTVNPPQPGGEGNGENPTPGTGGETAQDKDAPSFVSAEKPSLFSEELKLHFGFTSEAEEFIRNVTSVKVNDTVLNKGNYNALANEYRLMPTDGKLAIHKDSFNQDANTVEIKATGYKTVTLKLDRNGNVVNEPTPPAPNPGGEGNTPNPGEGNGDNTGGNVTPPSPQPEEGQAAPKVKSARKTPFGGYEVIIGTDNDVYMRAITSITVNNDSYSDGYLGDNKNYSIRITDGEIALGTQSINQEVNTVVIKATGYKTQTFKIKKSDGTLVADETPAPSPTPGVDNNGGSPQPPAPNPGSGSEVTPTPQPPVEETGEVPPNMVNAEKPAFFSEDYKVFFGFISAAERFVGKITSVTVNGVAMTKTTSFSVLQNEYKLWQTDGKVGIHKDAFNQDVNTIVIKATGYKTFTVKLNKNAQKVD